MTAAEAGPDDEKSRSIWPSAAVWLPNPVPYSQKFAPTFSGVPSPAIGSPSLRGHLGNVG